MEAWGQDMYISLAKAGGCFCVTGRAAKNLACIVVSDGTVPQRLIWTPFERPLGVCAIYSETTLIVFVSFVEQHLEGDSATWLGARGGRCPRSESAFAARRALVVEMLPPVSTNKELFFQLRPCLPPSKIAA